MKQLPRRAIPFLTGLALMGASFASVADAGLDRCFAEAADRYDVSAPLLKAIARVESSLNPTAVSPQNSDGSHDIGVMQVNSSWLPRLGREYGITRDDLLKDACLNVSVGAWILAHNFRLYGWDWRAIGAYNAGTADDREELRRRYAQRVYAALKN